MFSAKDKRQLNALRQDGYFTADNPLTKKALLELRNASESRPQWYEAFMDMPSTGVEEMPIVGTDETELIEYAETWTLDRAEGSVFALFGRDEIVNQVKDPKVIREWIKQGLGVTSEQVARTCDVSPQWARKVRDDWGDEIRALLQEAACLGLSNSDLYTACDPALPVPMRLLQRLRELREARGSKGGMLRQEFDRWLKSQWLAYKQRFQNKWDTDYPPSWFIKMVSE